MYKYHREWTDYPILSEEKQNTENLYFWFFFSLD
jgi:hypothetical protein